MRQRSTNVNSTIDTIIARPYTRELVPSGDGYWLARVVELPGCATQGRTLTGALAKLDDAMRSWLEVNLETGASVPEPMTGDYRAW
jgi:predicted RNase H-like HicB family nuclease